jgi:hypothetical protein
VAPVYAHQCRFVKREVFTLFPGSHFSDKCMVKAHAVAQILCNISHKEQSALLPDFVEIASFCASCPLARTLLYQAHNDNNGTRK